MTSLEIAELTGKQHKDVLKAIRKMEPAWENVCKSKFRLTSRTIVQPNGGTREVPCYSLTKTECLYIATKFNDEARAKLVLRWEELEMEDVRRRMSEVRCLPQETSAGNGANHCGTARRTVIGVLAYWRFENFVPRIKRNKSILWVLLFYAVTMVAGAIFLRTHALQTRKELAERGSVGKVETVGNLGDAQFGGLQKESGLHDKHLVDIVDHGAARDLTNDTREIDGGDM